MQENDRAKIEDQGTKKIEGENPPDEKRLWNSSNVRLDCIRLR